MRSDRTRGTILYAGAAALLGAGAFWWSAAAPPPLYDPQVEQWQASALQLLPDAATQVDSGTVTLGAGAEHQVLADTGPGAFLVSVICVGGSGSAVRIRLGEVGDSGRGLRCSGETVPQNFAVGLADGLRMNVSVTEASPVVFRYALLRANN